MSQEQGGPDIERIVEVFEFLGDWEQRYQFLIELGAKLPDFPPAEQREENRVIGRVGEGEGYDLHSAGGEHLDERVRVGAVTLDDRRHLPEAKPTGGGEDALVP